ncbi:MBOAT family O-acyltransferase [Tardiphaga sp. 538_B7_N1_4]|uniref:MBOAT family O-acyltransferase n=1 Tax=Tardiphaga sp. 538_B7_N1_4 TaxID=3240778 RepID=UPI003F29BCDD
MSFSSPGFIFAFMPVFFACYYVLPSAWRNGWLMLASLAFYSIDGGLATWVLIASIVVNYGIGLLIEGRSSRAQAALLLVIGIVLNLIPLLYYKYWNFLISSANDVRGLAGIGGSFSLADIALPAGISFFTFQGLSYIIDIYRRECRSARTIVDFGMYHTLFPQLVAGPIVRYREVERTIINRPVAMDDVEQGILRFCIGLAKKIIIADSMGIVADSVFHLAPGQLTMTAAWVGALAYTLQIFFDFSGYSDMAIGLGKALGFRFPENFNQPYRSLSITEFWRRWHMTLSRWFRDYVYIPLGGNREGHGRTYFNLVVVFFLCGLWHGAAYTFILWGLYHGALLVAERARGGALMARLPPVVSWALTLLLVIVGWVLFRAATLGQAVAFLKAMAGFGSPDAMFDLAIVLSPDKLLFFAIGWIIALWPAGYVLRMPGVVTLGDGPTRLLRQVGTLALFVYSAALVATNGFNPFIYFRF